MTILPDTLLLERYRVVSVHETARSTWGTALDTGSHSNAVVHFKVPRKSNSVVAEAETLQRAQDMRTDMNDVRLPQVLAVDGPAGILITEYVPDTKSLFNYLWEQTSAIRLRRFRQVQPATVGRSLGTWLRHFSESSRSSNQLNANDLFEKLLRNAFGRLRALSGSQCGNFLSHETASKAQDILSQLRASIEITNALPVAQIHGDLNLSNILVQPDGGLFVIDFGDSRPGLIHEDFANVWQTVWGISQLSTRRQSLLRPCLVGLLKSYALDIDSFVRIPAFQFLRVTHAIILMQAGVSHAEGFGRFGRSVYRQLAHINQKWLEAGCPSDQWLLDGAV